MPDPDRSDWDAIPPDIRAAAERGPVLIQTGRRGGKTHALVNAVKGDPGAVLVCATEAERQRIIEQYEMSPAQVITPFQGKLMGRDARVYVDNTEWVLERFLGGGSIEACSFNGEYPATEGPK